ncbi:MAG TPA: hypothetical protein VG246_00395 [Acidimicrobiales bacterium]|nr:hypothetical protein [Acidimicrobiales bacterium]
MNIPLAVIGFSVSDLFVSQRWYDLFFARGPDVLVSDDEVMWQMNEHARLFIVKTEPIRRCANVVLVAENLNDALAAPAQQEIEPRDVEVIDGDGRKAYFHDPDRNEIVLAEIYSQ